MKRFFALVLSAAFALTGSQAVLAQETIKTNQAIQELTALNIMSGYEDGTFRPENLVTRAEIAKMIVAARNEESTGKATFADSVNHWGSNYINQGVVDGFISGYDSSHFGPDDNVTFIQAQRMLVSALGYDEYAQAQGGWPNGYKAYAASTGITTGVSAKDNDELTRAQVAQMIDNALDIPLCVIDTYETTWDGSRVPKFKIKDGEGKDYQTILTEYHNAYKVYGRITSTYKSTSDNSLETNEAYYRVEKADNFDKEYIRASEVSDNDQGEKVYVGTSGAESYLNQYSQAIIQKDDNDEFTIISIVPVTASGVRPVTVQAEDIDNSKTDLENNKIYFFSAGSNKNSQKYSLADKVDFYVNEVYIGNFTEQEYYDYIFDKANDKGYNATTIELQKETKVGSSNTNSDYNIIKVTTYETFVVDQVIVKKDMITINFKEQSVNGNMKLYLDDEDYSYSFAAAGSEIDPADLEEDDVLSVSYDHNGSFADSKFYDVLVSRDIVDGIKCSSIDSKNNEFTFAGDRYNFAKGMSANIEVGGVYNLYLDAFGNIAMVDEDSTSKQLGILKNIYRESNGDYMAQIIDKAGQEIEAKVDSKNAEDYMNYLVVGTDKINAYPEQVIDYTINSSNKLRIKSRIPAGAQSDNGYYKESNNRIGSVRLSDSTIILDVSDPDNVHSTNIYNLVDGAAYTAFAYDKSSVDSTYRFVIITDGIGAINSKTQLAIFDGWSEVEDDKIAYDVVINNNRERYVLSDDVVIVTGEGKKDFAEGDTIVFSVNASDEITKVYNIFNITSIVNNSNYSTFRNSVFTNNIKLNNNIANLLSDNNDTVDLYFGPVVNKYGSTVTIGQIETNENGDYIVDYDKGIEINTKNANIYTYDFSASKKVSRVILDNGLLVTPDYKSAKTDEILNLSNEDVKDNIVFGLVRAIDSDDAQEIYLFIAE